MSKILSYMLFLLYLSLCTGTALYSMPDQAPAGDQAVAPEPAAMPADTSAAPPTTPDSTAAPAGAPAAPYEEVKSEQLGEFEVKEDLATVINAQDPKIVSLIQKSNEINKQISEITTDIQNMRDDMFNKFTDANNTLDAFYQKVGFECGKIKESLKEGK